MKPKYFRVGEIFAERNFTCNARSMSNQTFSSNGLDLGMLPLTSAQELKQVLQPTFHLLVLGGKRFNHAFQNDVGELWV